MAIMLFAGGDIRVNPELTDAPWDAERRGHYLLRPEVRRPLSIDPGVWPRPEQVEWSGDHPLPWIGVEEVRGRRRSLPSGGGEDGVILAIGVVAEDTHARDDLEASRGITTVVEAGPTWRFLGHDVADGTISGLSNCGYGSELSTLRATWAPRINDHGLIAQLDDAIAFRAITDARVREHAPFQVYGLWLVP